MPEPYRTWPAPRPADRIGGSTPHLTHKRKTWSGADRDRLIARLIERDGSNCIYCSAYLSVPIVISAADLEYGPLIICSVYPAHIDHRRPLSRGGDNRFENLQLTCSPCNLEKGTMLHEEYEEFWNANIRAEVGPGYERQIWKNPSPPWYLHIEPERWTSL